MSEYSVVGIALVAHHGSAYLAHTNAVRIRPDLIWRKASSKALSNEIRP